MHGLIGLMILFTYQLSDIRFQILISKYEKIIYLSEPVHYKYTFDD